MAKISKLSDIEVYRQALNLAQQIFLLVKNEKIKREYFLADQLKRSSLSVAANIAEGYGRNTRRDFAQFLSISLGSANEVIAYLDFLSLNYQINTTRLKDNYELLCRRIHSFRSYLLLNK